jgi:hypothetical protein
MSAAETGGPAFPEDAWERWCNAAREHGSSRPPYPPHRVKSDLRRAIKLIRKLRNALSKASGTTTKEGES